MSWVEAGGVDWYVERQGRGPSLLLIHGTGASAHSWAGMMPALAQAYDVLAIDLPGHGRSGPCPTPSLPATAAAFGALLDKLGVQPRVVVGHSAGAAIALRLAADGAVAPDLVVAFNGAFLPFGGRWGPGLWSRVARFLVWAGIPTFFARCWVSEKGVHRLVEQTGSRLDDEGVEAYRRLLMQPKHVAGALGMMAHWDLRPLVAVLPEITTPTFLVAAENDQTVLPRESAFVADRLPTACLVSWPGVGHLAHEEDPSEAVVWLREAERWLESVR